MFTGAYDFTGSGLLPKSGRDGFNVSSNNKVRFLLYFIV